jgi:DMSO/TMAO reductase YedYZ molybdopterin-dependent catalytic subunit
VEVRRALPNHPVPEAAEGLAALRIEGLVSRRRELGREAVQGLPRQVYEAPFVCEEGWSVPGLRWAGVRLLDVLELAGPLPAARFVRIGAGSFVLPLSLADAETALLCDELNGQPLTVEHGAPWRLLIAGGACFSSVKWVDRLELSDEPGDNTAEAIAHARLG